MGFLFPRILLFSLTHQNFLSVCTTYTSCLAKLFLLKFILLHCVYFTSCIYLLMYAHPCMNKWDSGLPFSPNISKIHKTHSLSFPPSLTSYLCLGKESPPPIYISLLTSSSTQDIFSPMTFLLFL